MSLTVTSILVEKTEQLEHLLDEVFALRTSNFFLSPNWIKTWFNQLSIAPFMIRVVDDKYRLVGAALFTNQTTKKSAFLSSSGFYLNATGNESLDQIWIEYNDCYFLPEREGEIKAAIVNFLYNELGTDEIIVGTSTPLQLAGWDDNRLVKHALFETKGYLVNLDKIRESNHQYKDALSGNTRYQINRSIKAYGQTFGTLTLQVAETAEQALAFFTDSAKWHKHRWADSQQSSGFDNPHFVNFHHSLIQQSFAEGHIQYLKVSAGEHILGYLYCFAYETKIYFYLSALNYDVTDKKLKPGMVMHYLAIQHFESLGFHSYDFLGGEARYKESLSTESYDLAMLAFKKPTYRFKLEDLLRRAKNSCTNRRRKAAIARSTKTV